MHAEMSVKGVMDVLTEDECLVLLGSHELGRIAFDVGGAVEILPVNYGIEGRIIVVRSDAGTKLAAVPHSAVAFEIDGWDPVSGTGWSVIAKGRAEEITMNPGRAAEHLRWVPVHPAAPGERWHWIAIMPTDIAGRGFHVPPAGAKPA
jgi:uncharacterized protein